VGSKLIKGSLQDGRNPQSFWNFSSFQSKMVGLEWEERFNICKHKFGTPPRSTRNSHHSGRDKFFVPCHCVTMFFILHNMLYFHISTFRCKFIVDIRFNNVQFANVASILSTNQTMSNVKEVSFKSQEVVEIDCI